jgi:hypothetical protein
LEKMQQIQYKQEKRLLRQQASIKKNLKHKDSTIKSEKEANSTLFFEDLTSEDEDDQIASSRSNEKSNSTLNAAQASAISNGKLSKATLNQKSDQNSLNSISTVGQTVSPRDNSTSRTALNTATTTQSTTAPVNLFQRNMEERAKLREQMRKEREETKRKKEIEKLEQLKSINNKNNNNNNNLINIIQFFLPKFYKKKNNEWKKKNVKSETKS